MYGRHARELVMRGSPRRIYISHIMKVENIGAHVATGSEIHVYSDTINEQSEVVLACLCTLDTNMELNGTSYKIHFLPQDQKFLPSVFEKHIFGNLYFT